MNFGTDERPFNWRAGVLMQYPNGKAPLTALTAMMKEEATDDARYHWWEKSLDNRRMRMTVDLAVASAGDAATLTVVEKAQTLKRGDIIYVERSGEIMWITADPISDTSIPVSRAFAGTTGAVVTVASHNPYIKVIGSAYEEASQAPTGVNFDPSKQYNFTQIFRQTLEMSRTAQKTTLRTQEQVKEAKRECLEYYSVGQEMAFWLGARSEGTIGGKPARTTGGVFSFIDSGNIVDQAGAALDLDSLEEDILEPMFRFGSSEKMAICGNRALLAINRCVRKNSTYNIQFGVKEYGMNVTRLTCPFGELVLKTHPLWNQMTSNLVAAGGIPVFYGMDSWLCALDMAELKYRYLKDSDTKYQPDLAENGLDGIKSGYLGECGIEVHHAKNHFLVKGLITGARDA